MSPMVSCICATYNRMPKYRHLLEEAIESFERQTWPHKELIILNDTPCQELLYFGPQVRVINTQTRYKSLGEKLNAAITASVGQFICCWDDDDISLPWRIEKSLELLGTLDYCNPRKYWLMNPWLQQNHATGCAHNCSMFRRSAYDRVGGYRKISGPQDWHFDKALKKTCSFSCPPLSRKDWWYIYRWGVGPSHISSQQDGNALYAEIGEQPVTTGRFLLHSYWTCDYVGLVKNYLEEGR